MESMLWSKTKFSTANRSCLIWKFLYCILIEVQRILKLHEIQNWSATHCMIIISRNDLIPKSQSIAQLLFMLSKCISPDGCAPNVTKGFPDANAQCMNATISLLVTPCSNEWFPSQSPELRSQFMVFTQKHPSVYASWRDSNPPA